MHTNPKMTPEILSTFLQTEEYGMTYLILEGKWQQFSEAFFKPQQVPVKNTEYMYNSCKKTTTQCYYWDLMIQELESEKIG